MSQPSQNPSQQPISFKTVPGRNRTQKWTQAKTNNYDGDDWGGYDDYDDYGGYQEPQSGQQLQRQPSFDRGVESERRQFSSGTAIYEPEFTSPAGNNGRMSQEDRSPDSARRRMREFSNPGQVPQPLNTPRSPVVPGSVERPPRKSSLVSGSPGPDVQPIPATGSPVVDKPMPFIRPSDIYKRMAEEQQKERQSMESGRPSMDAVQREVGSPSAVQHAFADQKSQEGLDPVNETREAKPMSPEPSLPVASQGSAPSMAIAQPTAQPTSAEPHSLHPSDSSPRLPPVSRISDFGSFMPRDEEEERISATGLAASTAAANAAASALSSGSRDVTPTMPAHQFQDSASHPGQSEDPAADIAAERSTDAPVEHLGRTAQEDPSGLSHQPSSGFRSVVHKAFDRQGDGSTPASPTSRENAQSEMSRSDTNSTRSISPIMSRVPSAATAQQRQQERDAVVPPIAEETPLEVARSRPAQDSTAPAISSRPSILRKPTPSHSRNVSSEIAGFTPGYRRSMDTPSPNNSPARTPGLGDTDSRRLSGPMAAVTVNESEAPDVDPSAPEMPDATLFPAETPLETPASTTSPVGGNDVVKPLPTTGRGRSGTDYSVRESDLAREANYSPENSPAVAEAATIQQNLFLDTHPSNPGTPTAMSPSGFARPFPLPAGSGSGRNSPAGASHSRVRNIVDQYHQIDSDSRRNSAASGMSSKSSWSNFGAEEDVSQGLTRRTTGGSALSPQAGAAPTEDGMFPSYERADQESATAPRLTSPSRPAAERLESFRPHLPGGWISAAPTPASEVPDAANSDPSRGRDHTSRNITPASPPTPKGKQFENPDEEVDLTPTTKKTKLHGGDPSNDADDSQSALAAVKNAGDALGTALMSSVGYGHQTQDFATKEEAPPVDIPEMRPHRQTGDIDNSNIPALRREDSDAPSEATNSVANSVPPTPPAKDTPQPPGLGANIGPTGDRPVSNYFAGYGPDAPAPLSFGKHSPSNSQNLAVRPAMMPSLSTDTRATDFESDRLRKDIVRSLGPEQMAEIKRESILEDTDRTQDALDAPNNERRVASGQSALPAAETKSAEGRSGLPSQAKPGLLNQRFSWENRHTDSSDNLYDQMAVVGETKGDENRESFGRPRSDQGLHVVNTSVTADSEPSTAEEDKQVEPRFMLNEPADAEKRLSSALPIGTAALALGTHSNTPHEDAASTVSEKPETHDGLDQMAPTPMVEDVDEAARAAEPQSPSVLPKDDSPTIPAVSIAAPQPSSAPQSKIPAFRDLAAIKSTDERIAAYESTRHRFADMNTGLSGWLSDMMAAHPEYADAGNQKYEGPAAIQTTGLSNTISGIGGTIRGAGHKHSPSILKIGGERKASTTSNSAATPTTSSGGGHADVEKMQAKGKDFMKSAGAGAKGLFAKGKSRFGRGGEKASSVSSPLVIAPAFAPADSSSKPVNKTAANEPTAEKAQASPRPVTPTGMNTVGGDVMMADRVPEAGAANTERPRSVFGRLRDVSRSRSRPGSMVFGSGFGGDSAEKKSPGPSRSVSRATSMILARGEAETGSRPTTPAPAVPAIGPSAPPPDATSRVSGLPGVMPDPMDRRREAWEGDDAEIADASWREENGRLGVLPSPSIQESAGPPSPGKARKGSWIGEPVDPPLEEVRAEEDAAAAAEQGSDSRAVEDAKWALPPAAAAAAAVAAQAHVPSSDVKQEDNLILPGPVSAEPLTAELTNTAVESDPRRSSLANIKTRESSPYHAQTRSASYASPAPTVARPQPERKFSALDELPSQQRRRQFTPAATPRRLSLAEGEAPESMPAQIGRIEGALKGEGPSAEANQMKMSRPATPANWAEFSAPKKAKDGFAATTSRRSSVSSLGNAQSLDTVVVPGASSKRQSVIGKPVGSAAEENMLSQHRSVSPLPISPVLSSTVPVMQPGRMPGSDPAPHGDFIDRGYQSQGGGSRPVSYIQHSRDSSGVMGQDILAVSQGNQRSSVADVPVDYSVAGAAAYQQIPAKPLSRAPSIGHPPSEYDKLRSPQAGDEEPTVGGTSSKRSSGFFRGSDVPTGGLNFLPSPSKLDENYNGLVDPQVSELQNDIAQNEQPNKRRKSGIMDTFRRTSTHSNANASASRPSSRGSFSKMVGASPSANETSLAKTKTLRKPQRASTSAAEPPKNKRFSSLGSIFRRSSTAVPRVNTSASGAQSSAQTSSQPPSTQAAPGAQPKQHKKLTKAQPPQSQQQQQQQQQQQYQYQQQQRQYAQNQGYHYGGPQASNYAAYEAMMRQQAHPGHGQQAPPQYWQQQPVYSEPAMVSSPYQQRQSGYYQQGPPTQYHQQAPAASHQQYQPSAPNSRSQSMVGTAPPEQSPPLEYYGAPKGQPPSGYGPPPQSTSPPPGQPMPQMRRLHSEGHRRRDTVPDIPEANSPTSSHGQSPKPAQSAFGEQAMAQAPSQQTQHTTARPTLDTRQSSTYSQASVVVSPVSNAAMDNFPQAPGRQDYQTQYWQHQNQSQRSTPAVSPIQTQVQPMYQQQQGIGSIDQQMARSPAREYQDQQTPYAISLPQGQHGENRNSDPSSWAQRQSPQYPQSRYIGAPAAARGAVRSASPPQRHPDQYSSMTPYEFVPPQRAPQGQRGTSYYGEQVSSPVSYTATSPQHITSPGSYTPTSPQGSPPQHESAYGFAPQQRRQGPQPQQRYYGQQRQMSNDGQARPLSYQRMSSGYSGRRDDAGLNEAEIMNVRGTSYPGQEWAPGRH